MSRRQSNLDTMAAIAGLLAAMVTAARSSGSRIGSMGREARRLAAESTGRGVVAYHALRGELPVQTQRSPVEYLAITVFAGATGAVAAMGIRRIVIRRSARREQLTPVPEPDAPSGVTRIPKSTTENVTA